VRRDILLALDTGMAVADISVMHPGGVAVRAAAAATDRAAAKRREGEKRRIYVRLEPNGYPFFPFALESYACLGKDAIDALAKEPRRQGAGSASPALWRRPLGSLA
jgi:hypothetical protein